MKRPQHNRAFLVTVAWTLALLFLGSVVHATGSSLACPDWPTCYGSMMPEMSGGIFWEHLHRLVAGGLILMFALATWLAWREAPERRGVLWACGAGIALLLVQAVLGGVTVILELPDAISTSHLLLALLFLGLATALVVATSPHRRAPAAPGARPWIVGAATLVLLQSVLGGWVRHAEAGMACPDIPLCLGEWVPPMENPLIALHFTHRLLGIVVALAVLALAFRLRRIEGLAGPARAAAVLVLAQVALGFASVHWTLAVTPVSLHTLVAASLFALLVAMWARAHPAVSGTEPAEAARAAVPAA